MSSTLNCDCDKPSSYRVSGGGWVCSKCLRWCAPPPPSPDASGQAQAAAEGTAGGSHEAFGILDGRVRVDPVCVSDWPDAHIVRFVSGNQRFDIGDAWETRDEAQLYAHLFSIAIARDYGLNTPSAIRKATAP